MENQAADCTISLNKDSAQIKGEGAEFADNVLTIKSAGTYEISGNLQGRIQVEADEKDKVNIILAGVEVACDNYAPFTVWDADRTVVCLKEGTENIFTDGNTYGEVSGVTEDEAPAAAVYSKDDIVFLGEGTLVVEASSNDGITGKDELIFQGGKYKITAKDDGIVGKDSVAIKNGEFVITAEGDGIKSTEDTDANKGFISIEDGTFEINSNNDGIQAETYCYITGGDFNIVTEGVENDSQTEESVSAKGIKAKVDVTICGGEFNIDSADDSIHSNDTMTIDSGNFTVATGDDGLHSDNTVLINSGNITITESYEGIEAENIIIKGGDIDIKASDDGINAANGESAEGMDGKIFNENAGNKEMPQTPENGEMVEKGRRPQIQEDGEMPEKGERPQMPENGEMPERGERPQMSEDGEMPERGERPQMPEDGEMPDNGERPQMPEDGEMPQMPDNGDMQQKSGNGRMSESGGEGTIYIEGGNIYIDADGDGIDSNGSVYMSGGTVYVDGPVNNGNGFFDYDKTFGVTGGTLVGAGSSGMLQSISDSSSQAGLAVVFDKAYSKGTEVCVKDSEGREIISYSPSKEFSAIVFSVKELETSESYEIFVDGESCKTVTLT